MVFGPEGSAIPPPQTAQDLAQGLSSIYFAANYLYNSVANVLTEPVQVTDLSQYYSQQSNLGDSDVFEFTQAFNAENFGVSGVLLMYLKAWQPIINLEMYYGIQWAVCLIIINWDIMKIEVFMATTIIGQTIVQALPIIVRL